MKTLKVNLLFPRINRYREDFFSGGRNISELRMDTGFVFLEANEERGNWLSLTLLGFGLGFSWGEDSLSDYDDL